MSGAGSIIVASNRLPVTVEETARGTQVRPSGGGLVSALVPILRRTGGCWIGWPGVDRHDGVLEQLIRNHSRAENYSLAPLFLTAAEQQYYYRGFSNEIIWPLFHGLPSRCQFHADYWNAYDRVNHKFADAIEGLPQTGDFIWVHDYHLMLLAQKLRQRQMGSRLAYFHHIPFPSADTFETLPWRTEILRSLMQFDVLGFQTARDRRNFIACLRRCLTGVRVCRLGEALLVQAEGRRCNIGAHPISIDYESFVCEASQFAMTAAATAIQTELPGKTIVLGVDRLDYTKGIPERLNAFQKLLEDNAELRGAVTLLQVVVPSREEIPEYAQLKLRIERQISEVNGRYSRPGWTPIQYFHRSISRAELIALYLAAHVALVTPLRDGMNLVAKEFCASRVDNRGVLVLSEFAGAADELKCGALLVNPYDIAGTAEALQLALRMGETEQERRMESMRLQIRSHDVFRWSQSFALERPGVKDAAIAGARSFRAATGRAVVNP